MDDLIEEFLQQQSESVQTFLLRTAILVRLCGPLCDAILPDASVNRQETIGQLPLEEIARCHISASEWNG